MLRPILSDRQFTRLQIPSRSCGELLQLRSDGHAHSQHLGLLLDHPITACSKSICHQS